MYYLSSNEATIYTQSLQRKPKISNKSFSSVQTTAKYGCDKDCIAYAYIMAKALMWCVISTEYLSLYHWNVLMISALHLLHQP